MEATLEGPCGVPEISPVRLGNRTYRAWRTAKLTPKGFASLYPTYDYELVGASFARDIGRKVASKTRSYRRKSMDELSIIFECSPCCYMFAGRCDNAP